MTIVDRNALQEGLQLVEECLADLDKVHKTRDGIYIAGNAESWHQYHLQVRAAEQAAKEKIEAGGGRVREVPTNGTVWHLQLAGTKTSCTSGFDGALRNWRAKVQRELEARARS